MDLADLGYRLGRLEAEHELVKAGLDARLSRIEEAMQQNAVNAQQAANRERAELRRQLAEAQAMALPGSGLGNGTALDQAARAAG